MLEVEPLDALGSPLFPGLNAEQIELIASKGQIRSFPRNTLLMNEGDDSDFMYFILSGRVKVFANDFSGKEVVLNIEGPGEYFGELSLIDETPRSASVMSLEPVELSYISRQVFQACLQDNPELAARFLGSLTQRVRYLTHVVKNLALNNVYGRLVLILNRLSEPDEQGWRKISMRLTHQEIAHMVGASRVMVTKMIGRLVDEGYVAQKDKMIFLLKKLPESW
ncbi:MAG TPA: Crp/Fnr family transcriptional regulator [Gammaproteobacteria bacterium]|nr:Crp/Fnr family transcriptional regulator [Gammaproteobacteria bacterium]